jgi:hypothetical protein
VVSPAEPPLLSPAAPPALPPEPPALVVPPVLVEPPEPPALVESPEPPVLGEVVELAGDVVVVEGEPVVELVVGDVVESFESLLSESPPQLTQKAEIEIRVR